LLKGMNNAKMVRHLRELNPGAKIIVTADVLTDVPALYSAGADYVSVGRLDEAADLCAALEAADASLLAKKRAQLDARLANRKRGSAIGRGASEQRLRARQPP
jgi:hypothetical protein